MAQAQELRKLRGVPEPPPAPPPLSFSRWLARRTRGWDLLMLLLELLTMSTMHTEQLMFSRVCVPVGGGPHAALQELPLEPAAHPADALLAAFPCGASHAGRLYYVLRTAAVVDPRIALRLTDYSILARILGQLTILAIMLACPRLYERTRHGLFFAQNAAVLLGCCASARLTPAPLLPMVSAAFFTAGRRRMGAVYFGWKAVTVDRVPSSLQLFFGPALWLLAIIATPLVDRRLLPYGASQPQHLQAPHAALLLVVMAILPYLASRYFEHTSLRPQYRAYLLGRRGMGGGGSEGSSRSASKDGSTAGGSSSEDNAPGSGAGSSGGCGADPSAGSCEGFSSSRSGCVTRLLSPGPEARMIPPLSTGNLPRLRSWAGAPGGAAAAVPAHSLPPAGSRALLYRSSRGGDGAGRVLLLSVKAMLPGDGHTSGGPSFKETAALARNAAVAALRAHNAAASGDGGSSGSGQPALLQPGAGAARFSLMSAQCVEGCVHMLMMVRREGGGGSGSGGIHHCRIEEDAASGGIAAAVESAMQQLLTEAAAGEDAVPLAPSAFAWPPALPTTAAAEEGAASNVRSSSNRRETPLAQASEVLLLLPAALLRELRAVRCVVAGPSAEPQRQAVHLDVTIAGAGATEGSESEGGCAAFRLQLPPAALRGPGALTIFVLPPSPADTAPLATFPLLVLPAAAVAEVRQLYGEVLGQEVYDSLEQQLLLEDMARGGPDGWSLAASASAAAASASAAIQQGGLDSLLYDMGALLQLPARGEGEAAGGGAASGGTDSQALAQQLPFEAASSFADLLRFLASQRMGACLQEGLRALRRAGARDGEALGGGGGHGAVEAAALRLLREAGETEDMGPTSANGQPTAPQPAAQQPSSSIGQRPGVPPPPSTGGGPTISPPERFATFGGVSGAAAGASGLHATSRTPDTAASAHASGRPLRSWARLPRGALTCWLRMLLLGFSPPGQERSYQAFKAAQCCRINLMYFLVLPLVRLATFLRTLRAVQAESAPVPAAEGIGAGRLSALQQQLLAQAFFLAAGLLMAVLAFGTPLLQRGRNTLLLAFKMVLEPITYLLTLWPPEWGGPLLRTPDAWLDAGRRYGMHWLYEGVFSPAMLQLSPRHQLWSTLANLLPMTLLGLQIYRGRRWVSALGFGAGHAVLSLAVSVATDLTTRQHFVRQRARHTAKAE